MSHRATTIVVFSILAALPPAVAQSPAPNASGASAIAPSQDGTRLLIRENRDAATDADARLCLEYPTNLQVIVCAEKYRTHKRRA